MTSDTIYEVLSIRATTPDAPWKIRADPADSAVITGSNGQVNANENVVLTCTSTGGKPSPIITLRRGGTTLKTGSFPLDHSFTAQMGGDGATLVCDATNLAGTVSDQVTFAVSSNL